MLKQISCDLFLQKDIVFESGFNVVVGDDIASNSIGKSTILMIIDFIFGGEEYIKKNHDVIEQLNHHSFRFAFEFSDKMHYFIRNTNDYKYVSYCNEKYEIIENKKIDEYTFWLQKKYGCELEDLSFRNIIGRYFRVYGKENLNERKPIQYFEKETSGLSISALLKLFDKYKTLKVYEQQIRKLKGEKDALVEAEKQNLIPRVVTKTLFVKNESKIAELSKQLGELKSNIVTATIDIEALISKEVLKLRREKSTLTTQRNVLENRLIRTQQNLNNKNINIKTELEQFTSYFPNFNVEQIEKVDGFHKTITQILKSELQEAKKDLMKQINGIEEKIIIINQEIEANLNIKDAPKYAIDKVLDLVAEINRLNDENEYYTKRRKMQDLIVTATADFESLREKSLDEVCRKINTEMYELNKEIYSDNRRAPTLNIHGNKYTFNTNGDTGTGTAFANLISFDLAVLGLTCLPALAHDLPLLKNIENSALEKIIEIYSRSTKQIFIAIDKVSSYSETALAMIEKHRVLQLSKDKLLFVKNWKTSEDPK